MALQWVEQDCKVCCAKCTVIVSHIFIVAISFGIFIKFFKVQDIYFAPGVKGTGYE